MIDHSALEQLRQIYHRIRSGHEEVIQSKDYDELRSLAVILNSMEGLGVHYVYPQGDNNAALTEAINKYIHDVDSPGALIVGLGDASFEQGTTHEAILYSILLPGYVEGYVVVYDRDYGRIVDKADRLEGTSFAPAITAFMRH